MSFAYDLHAHEFSAPELNAPRPCTHASNCYYNGASGCAFVHPGEEGAGMKIFPARSVKDPQTGKETWQKATVRLIGGASFYERRRLKMSWPQWCALPKNMHLQRFKASAPQLAPSVAPLFAQQPVAQLAPSVASLFNMAAMASFTPQAIAMNAKMVEEMKRQQMGNALYAVIAPFIEQNKQSLKDADLWSENITAGKITGMLLEGISYEELYSMLYDSEKLKDTLAECCDILKAAA